MGLWYVLLEPVLMESMQPNEICHSQTGDLVNHLNHLNHGLMDRPLHMIILISII